MASRATATSTDSRAVKARQRGPGAPDWNGGKPAPYWKPGQSGNPGGRPSTKPITEAYNRILDMPATALGKFVPRTQAETVAWTMIRRACAMADKLGVAATKEITDRVEGAPDRTMRLTDHTGERPPRVMLEFTQRGLRLADLEQVIPDDEPAPVEGTEVLDSPNVPAADEPGEPDSTVDDDD